jgi:hypothetical protein
VSVVVFLGPTLAPAAARRVLRATYRPPAAQGDVYAAARGGARVIGLVDGAFESVPSVWHKEILWALARGIAVFGSASLGALRAAETEAFGMIGVGEVYEAFRSGTLEDDDEVAVIHGPEDAGFRPLSEAMVNIRATLRAAAEAGVLSRSSGLALEAEAKRWHFPERCYPALLRRGAALGVPDAETARLRAWLARGRVDLKRADALAMLRRIRAAVKDGLPGERPRFVFEHTVFWERVVRRVHVARPGPARGPLARSDRGDDSRLERGEADGPSRPSPPRRGPTGAGGRGRGRRRRHRARPRRPPARVPPRTRPASGGARPRTPACRRRAGACSPTGDA